MKSTEKGRKVVEVYNVRFAEKWSTKKFFLPPYAQTFFTHKFTVYLTFFLHVEVLYRRNSISVLSITYTLDCTAQPAAGFGCILVDSSQVYTLIRTRITVQKKITKKIKKKIEVRSVLITAGQFRFNY